MESPLDVSGEPAVSADALLAALEVALGSLQRKINALDGASVSACPPLVEHVWLRDIARQSETRAEAIANAISLIIERIENKSDRAVAEAIFASTPNYHGLQTVGRRRQELNVGKPGLGNDYYRIHRSRVIQIVASRLAEMRPAIEVEDEPDLIISSLPWACAMLLGVADGAKLAGSLVDCLDRRFDPTGDDAATSFVESSLFMYALMTSCVDQLQLDDGERVLPGCETAWEFREGLLNRGLFNPVEESWLVDSFSKAPESIGAFTEMVRSSHVGQRSIAKWTWAMADAQQMQKLEDLVEAIFRSMHRKPANVVSLERSYQSGAIRYIMNVFSQFFLSPTGQCTQPQRFRACLDVFELSRDGAKNMIFFAGMAVADADKWQLALVSHMFVTEVTGQFAVMAGSPIRTGLG